MKSLVVKVMMPVAAFILASAGAIGTNASKADSKSSSTLVQGWKRISAFDCAPRRTCNNIENVICKDGIDNMYARPTLDDDCSQLLTHKP